MRWSAVALSALALLGCATDDKKSDNARSVADPALQAIVDRVAGANRDVARLSIHTIPAGSSRLTIVASTVPGRVGEPSDPEDLDASRTGRPVVMREGHNLDYTESVADAPNRTTAVIGVTISGASGMTDDALLDRAKKVAAEVAAAIRAPR
ncbi:MAG TPA: hypothetical protein VEI02_07665 [Planctomycetota bacterium]|nr:hypothetical protein [Planctomycetota bacterium]